jgi:hypothetical protein
MKKEKRKTPSLLKGLERKKEKIIIIINSNLKG